jgi:RecA-family ATPase
MPSPREWLLGTTFCRTFLSSLVAAGGVGKTAVRYAQFLSLTSGRSELTGEYVHQRSRVLVISLEDDDKELKRRMLAAMKHHKITHADVRGWLFVSAPGRSAGKLLEMDPVTRRMQLGELRANIEAAILRRKPDVVSLDPFVKSHAAEENSNSVIDEVAQILTDLAAKYNIAIDAPHHVSKGAADPGNADKARGASAMVDAARLVKTLTVMSADEAKTFGIKDEDRVQFLRVDNGKTNLARRGGAPQWFKLIGVPLDNAPSFIPMGIISKSPSRGSRRKSGRT